jgi:hypothetical protein
VLFFHPMKDYFGVYLMVPDFEAFEAVIED